MGATTHVKKFNAEVVLIDITCMKSHAADYDSLMDQYIVAALLQLNDQGLRIPCIDQTRIVNYI